MMVAAERHGEFVANLATEGSRLREFQMMGIARRALTDQAGLRADEREVGRVAASHRGGITLRSLRRTDQFSWTLLICSGIQSTEHDLIGSLDNPRVVGCKRVLGGQTAVRP